MSDFEVVKQKLAEDGITVYSLYQANGCVGVSYGRVSAYYFVRDEKVVDIIFD